MADPRVWAGRRVLVTGHTGFKGAWLALWLERLGARVTGFASAPPTEPSLFAAARVGEVVEHLEGDVRDRDAVGAAVARARPDVVFHLAAQAIVRQGLRDPVGTFTTNVTGTAHLLDAARDARVVCVTSDKCYAPAEEPHTEDAPLGGSDPYSASKAAQEHVCAAFRASAGVRVATARAGNVIGGGDWAADRLVPDAVRALDDGGTLDVRFPAAVRPWQHVLEPLGGYLLLAERLERDPAAAAPFNFGPAPEDAWTVRAVVEALRAGWNGRPAVRWGADAPHEAPVLRLDASRAAKQLGWKPRRDLRAGLDATVQWYAAYRRGADARALVHEQIEDFERA
jgi:CDP-glucose 4,6-dehydratase